MKQATLAKQYDENTALYKLDAPMTFSKHSDNENDTFGRVKSESDHVVLHKCVVDGIPRTVIHHATQLKGGDGFCYGGSGARVLDCDIDHIGALNLSGYELVA